MSNKVSLFVKEVIARISGDDAEVLAIKNSRKAESGINLQISTLKVEKVEAEGNLESAKEDLLNAQFPKTEIKDSKQYIKDILEAQKKVDAAEEYLETIEESIKYFETLVKKIFSEVEA